MKDAFENNFKQSLENFEMPYDVSAWSAMQSRLDASASAPSFEDKMKDSLNANNYPYNAAAWTAMKKRLDRGAKGGLKKWHVAAGIIGAAVITSVIVLNSNSDASKTTEATPTAQVDSTIEMQNADQGQNALDNNQSSTAAVVDQKTTTNGENKTTAASNVNSESSLDSPPQNTTQGGNVAQSGADETRDPNDTGNDRSNPANTGETETTTTEFILPAIPDHLCQGASFEIENANDYLLVVKYPNGLVWTGREKQITRLNPSTSGTYEVGYMHDHKFVKKASFHVDAAPDADFDFVDLTEKYLNGLPTIEVRSSSQAVEYVWDYKNGTVRGEEVGLHFYEKGVHPVRLTVTNANGCSSTVEKTVSIDEKYNLLAPNSFNPNSAVAENKTFMPFALTERNTPFTLLILDPNDGHVMYETSDPSKGWNGIDQSTGTMAPNTTTYIWKVTLSKPMSGEGNAYTGTILLL